MQLRGSLFVMKPMNAGGTQGGAGRFFLGLAMIVVGAYLFLDAVHIVNHFRFYSPIFSYRGLHLRSGMVLVPFIFGIGFIFYNARWVLGWILAIGSLIMFGFGIVTSIHFQLRAMTAFDIIVILVLLVGGAGLFISSLRDLSASNAEPAPGPAGGAADTAQQQPD